MTPNKTAGGFSLPPTGDGTMTNLRKIESAYAADVSNTGTEGFYVVFAVLPDGCKYYHRGPKSNNFGYFTHDGAARLVQKVTERGTIDADKWFPCPPTLREVRQAFSDNWVSSFLEGC